MCFGLKKKIKVGFFISTSSEWFGGINYLKNLFYALNYSNSFIQPVVSTLNNDYETINLFKSNTKILKEGKIKKKLIKFLGEHKGSEIYYKMLGINVISHSDAFYLPYPIKRLNWIPDFQHIHMPEMFSEEEIIMRNLHYKNIADNSNIVILSSYESKKDFENFSPENKHKTRVLQFVSIPPSEIFSESPVLKEEVYAKYGIHDKFFYIPNQLWKHKNHLTMFKAVKILKDKGININVICTGHSKDGRNPEHYQNLTDFIKDNNLTENIKILGLVEYKYIPYFIRNCISVINPSFFEGWSTTVEETKSVGKSIILSDIPVHKEQSPLYSTYFNPNDPEELAGILNEKWNQIEAGADYKLEKNAKEQLGQRILEFAQKYESYVREIL